MGAIAHHVDDWRAETGEQPLHLLARQPVQLHARELAQPADRADRGDDRSRQQPLQRVSLDLHGQRVAGRKLEDEHATRRQHANEVREVLADEARGECCSTRSGRRGRRAGRDRLEPAGCVDADEV